MKKLLKIVSPVLVLMISIFIVQALSAARPAPEKNEDAQRLLSLYVDEVRADVVTISVQSQGEVRPKLEIDLVPQVSGRIVAVSERFAEGAEFDPDTMLLKIDDSDYRLAVTRAEAEVAAAQTRVERELANEKIKAEQWADRRNKGTPTPFALNKPQVNEARAKLRAAEAELEGARNNLARTEIRVPFKGRVREKDVGIGQFVTAGTRLGRVFATDIVEIRLPLTDAQLAELNLPIGFTADAFSAPLVNFTARVGNREHTWEGRIVRTNSSVDQQTRLLYAIAEVNDPYDKGSDAGSPLAVGMFVRANIAGTTSRPALVLPRMALRKADKVYVINADNRLEIRTVEVISTSKDKVLVASGVEQGEQVVTSTIPAAVDGMEVRAITRQSPS